MNTTQTYKSFVGVEQCISERVNLGADLIRTTGTDARFGGGVVRSVEGTIEGEAYYTGDTLPRYYSFLSGEKIYTAELVKADVRADYEGRAVVAYGYKVAENTNWRKLFPNLDFLMCPILQGITDADLDNGKSIENIAGTHPVTLTTSSYYLYPDKRLIHIDEDGYMVMRADGVEKYERLWSTYPYNMWGAVAYPSNGHYCVAMVYENEPHRLWDYTFNSSGVELQQNAHGWNATEMYHYKNGGRVARAYYAVNATKPTGAVTTAGTCVLIYNINIDAGRLPETYVYIRNVTTGVTHYDLTRTGTKELNPPETINVYWRSYANGYGRVKWFGIMRGTQDENTISMLKYYLEGIAAD
jgi:hypothetical protein